MDDVTEPLQVVLGGGVVEQGRGVRDHLVELLRTEALDQLAERPAVGHRCVAEALDECEHLDRAPPETVFDEQSESPHRECHRPDGEPEVVEQRRVGGAVGSHRHDRRVDRRSSPRRSRRRSSRVRAQVDVRPSRSHESIRPSIAASPFQASASRRASPHRRHAAQEQLQHERGWVGAVLATVDQRDRSRVDAAEVVTVVDTGGRYPELFEDIRERIGVDREPAGVAQRMERGWDGRVARTKVWRSGSRSVAIAGGGTTSSIDAISVRSGVVLVC